MHISRDKMFFSIDDNNEIYVNIKKYLNHISDKWKLIAIDKNHKINIPADYDLEMLQIRSKTLIDRKFKYLTIKSIGKKKRATPIVKHFKHSTNRNKASFSILKAGKLEKIIELPELENDEKSRKLSLFTKKTIKKIGLTGNELYSNKELAEEKKLNLNKFFLNSSANSLNFETQPRDKIENHEFEFKSEAASSKNIKNKDQILKKEKSCLEIVGKKSIKLKLPPIKDKNEIKENATLNRECVIPKNNVKKNIDDSALIKAGIKEDKLAKLELNITAYKESKSSFNNAQTIDKSNKSKENFPATTDEAKENLTNLLKISSDTVKSADCKVTSKIDTKSLIEFKSDPFLNINKIEKPKDIKSESSKNFEKLDRTTSDLFNTEIAKRSIIANKLNKSDFEINITNNYNKDKYVYETKNSISEPNLKLNKYNINLDASSSNRTLKTQKNYSDAAKLDIINSNLLINKACCFTKDNVKQNVFNPSYLHESSIKNQTLNRNENRLTTNLKPLIEDNNSLLKLSPNKCLNECNRLKDSKRSDSKNKCKSLAIKAKVQVEKTNPKLIVPEEKQCISTKTEILDGLYFSQTPYNPDKTDNSRNLDAENFKTCDSNIKADSNLANKTIMETTKSEIKPLKVKIEIFEAEPINDAIKEIKEYYNLNFEAKDLDFNEKNIEEIYGYDDFSLYSCKSSPETAGISENVKYSTCSQNFLPKLFGAHSKNHNLALTRAFTFSYFSLPAQYKKNA